MIENGRFIEYGSFSSSSLCLNMAVFHGIWQCFSPVQCKCMCCLGVRIEYGSISVQFSVNVCAGESPYMYQPVSEVFSALPWKAFPVLDFVVSLN